MQPETKYYLKGYATLAIMLLFFIPLFLTVKVDGEVIFDGPTNGAYDLVALGVLFLSIGALGRMYFHPYAESLPKEKEIPDFILVHRFNSRPIFAVLLCLYIIIDTWQVGTNVMHFLLLLAAFLQYKTINHQYGDYGWKVHQRFSLERRIAADALIFPADET